MDKYKFLEVSSRGAYITPCFSYRTIVFFNWGEFIKYVNEKRIRSGFTVGFIIKRDELPNKIKELRLGDDDE